MGNYENLKQSITEVIRTNGNKEITGAVLQSTLLTIISTVGANATFAGIATPSTNPGTPDGSVFYLASESGTYSNFGSVELQDGLSVLMWNGSWNSQQIFSIDNEPTAGSDNLVKSGGVAEELALGAVYDVSAKNPTSGVNNDGKWESLSALLSDTNLNTLIPTPVRKGGMSIKFIQSSDNKYVKYRCMAQSFTTDTTQWAISGDFVYIESPEWLLVLTDNRERILFGFRKSDGKAFFGAGIPPQIAEYILEVANSKVDKEVGKSLISSEVADCQSMIESPEWMFVILDKDDKILSGIRVNGEIYPPSVDPEIQQDVEKLKEDVSTLNQRIVNCEQEAGSSLEAYSSVASSIESLNEGVDRNAQEIGKIKEIEGFSVAEEVEERLEGIESDVSGLKSQAGVGTDIISLNGGDKSIKDVLYGFKHLAFRSVTNIPPDYANTAKDSLVLLHFSDIHDNNTNAARLKSFFDTYRMISGKTAIDDAIFTGDLVDYTYGYSKYGQQRNEWADWHLEDALFGIGNHDIIMGVSTKTAFENANGWGKVPTKDNYDYFIAPYVSRWNVVQPANAATKGKLYYYKDYPTLGYRLIMLDCFVHRKPYRNDGGTLTEIPNTWTYDPTHVLATLSDINTITNAVVGTLFYVGGGGYYDTYVVDTVSNNQITAYTPVVWQVDDEYRQEQNTWLEETLAGAKALGYHCITTRHQAGVGTPVDCYWHTDGTENNAGPGTQGNDIDSICNTFVEGGGVIVCDLNGHWHCNRVQYPSNGILSICIDSASYYLDYGYNIRVINEKSMDAFNLFAINKGTGCITLYRIGVDKNKDGKGHQILVYDYINKKVKYQY